MLGRRFIMILIGIVFILGGVTCALGYFVLRPLLINTGGGALPADVNTLTAVVKGVNGSNGSIVIQRTNGYDLIRYDANTRISRQGGLQTSINEVYQCSTVTATGGRDNTEFRADQIIIVPVSEAPAGQFTGTVIVSQAELRPIPDPRVRPSGMVTQGMRLSLHGRCGTDSNWLAVTAPGGVRGWVDREFVEIDDATLSRLPWLSLDPSRFR